jgi:hypothetical protein
MSGITHDGDLVGEQRMSLAAATAMDVRKRLAK